MNILIRYLSKYFKTREEDDLDHEEWQRLLDKAKNNGYNLQWVIDKYGAYINRKRKK